MITTYKNKSCVFKVCHQRGQILSWQPAGHKDVLWCTDEQFISLDKPIRGGIPLCWPWFAKGDNGDLTPSHGFARLADWVLVTDEKLNAGTHHLVYQLSDEQASSPHYSHDFVLTFEYLIGETLTISLLVQARQSSSVPPSFGALHSYFNLGDIEQTVIEGLGTQSVDNLDDFNRVDESEQVTIKGPTEKRFPYDKNARQQIQIHDKANQRHIMITQNGHSDTMLWSPWTETGRSLKDTHPGAYKHFVCVEAAAISRPIQGHMELQIEVF